MACRLMATGWSLWLPALLVTMAAPARSQGPVAAPTPLQAADEAARRFDYDAALKALAQAAQSAGAEDLSRIKQRQVLYERLLSMPALVDFAKANPATLIGVAITRDGRNLQGVIQLLELGVTAGAAIGARRLEGGTLELQTGPETVRTLRGRELAQVSVTWAAPDEAKSTYLWSIEQVRVVLQTGEVVTGKPTWLMPFSNLSVRPPGSTQDTDLLVFPGSGRTEALGGLVTELLLVGGPPLAGEETAAGPVSPTTPGPVSGRPEVIE